MRWQMPDQPDSPGSISVGPRGALFALTITLALFIAGCGYTVLKDPNQPTPRSNAQEKLQRQAPREPESELPAGHPPIDDADEWLGRSFLDFLVGEDDAYRFENVREMRHIDLPNEHAELTFKLQVGSSAVSDVWQIRVDEFGWMSVARWVQGAGGPEVDETMATRRIELRLDRASEAALRFMVIGLLPNLETRRHVPDLEFYDLARDMWHHQDTGLMTLDYRIEALDRLREDWPGGEVKRRLDLIQILIGTWDRPPPDELVNLVYHWAGQDPALLRIAMLAEALVLAWEVEGEDQEHIELPLKVGR